MSVNMIVDVIRKSKDDFFKENPVIPQGSLAFNTEDSYKVGEKYESGIKLGDGKTLWRDLSYLEIPYDIAKKWHTFAKNSGTNSRLVTLPDFNIAYASFDASSAETEELLKSIQTNLKYENNNLIFSGEQVNIEVNSDIENPLLTSIKLGTEENKNIFTIADIEAREKIQEIFEIIESDNNNNNNNNNNDNNNSETNPNISLIDSIPVFGSDNNGEKIQKGVIEIKPNDISGENVFMNSFGEWKNIQIPEEKTRMVNMNLQADFCQQTENMPYYYDVTTFEFGNDGKTIEFVLEVEEIPVNSGLFAFNLEKFIESGNEGTQISWKDKFSPVFLNDQNTNSQEVFITFKKKGGLERKVLYCEKNGTFLKNYWPDVGIVSAEYFGEAVNLVETNGFPDEDVKVNEQEKTVSISLTIPSTIDDSFNLAGAEILVPQQNAETIVGYIKNKYKVYIDIIDLKGNVIINSKEFNNTDYFYYWENNSTYQKLAIRVAQDGTEKGTKQIEFDKPGVVDIGLSVPNYYTGAPYFISCMNAFGENNFGGDQIDFEKVKMITCYPNYDFTEEKTTIQNQMKAYSCLLYGIYYQDPGALQFYFSEKPTSNINIILKLEEF